MEEMMEKKELREGLLRLKAYFDGKNFQSAFLEEGKDAELDSLLLGLIISEELSIDISCNYVDVPGFGNMLQYYGQLQVDELFAENPDAFGNEAVLELLNELNQIIPIGQFLFMHDNVNGEEMTAIGIRYTMLTALDNDTEMEKCASVIQMLMNIYELLCSGLMLLCDGASTQKALQIMKSFMNE